MDAALKEFISELPKVELHCHIEGTLEPELMFALAERNGVALPYDTVESLRAAYRFDHLQDFLDIYYKGMDVLRTEQDFYDLAWAYLVRANGQNVRHTEIFFDPQGHVSRGISLDTAVVGITSALDHAEREFGVSSELIMCFLRHLNEDDAFRTLEQAESFRLRIRAVGLDSSERGNPPENFTRVFAAAADRGYLRVAHAGEEGPPAYIYGALDSLGVDRIDHGNSCLEDPELVRRLARDQVPLTVCPLSNLRLCVVPDIQSHPLATMLEHGLKVTVNSDDPAYFGGYMNENLEAVCSGLGLGRKQLATLTRNAIDAAFTEEPRRQALHEELDLFLATWND
jgi:adenosine deaminase